jgi:Uri superfamily endonuclease
MKGIYVLIIDVRNPTHINVGKLGAMTFTAGLYAYIGSAQNNIEKRVERHLRKRKRLFWHIDYLLGQDDVTVLQVLCKSGAKEEECRIAKSIAAQNKAVRSFGCSDCRCESHLFKLSENTAHLANLGLAPFLNPSIE